MLDLGAKSGGRAHRAGRRAHGLRRVQIWVPDVTAEGFAAEAHRQSRAVAASEVAEDDQAFVDAVSDWPEERGGGGARPLPPAPATPASPAPRATRRPPASTPAPTPTTP